MSFVSVTLLYKIMHKWCKVFENLDNCSNCIRMSKLYRVFKYLVHTLYLRNQLMHIYLSVNIFSYTNVVFFPDIIGGPYAESKNGPILSEHNATTTPSATYGAASSHHSIHRWVVNILYASCYNFWSREHHEIVINAIESYNGKNRFLYVRYGVRARVAIPPNCAETVQKSRKDRSRYKGPHKPKR
jgi:hypothetical protein